MPPQIPYDSTRLINRNPVRIPTSQPSSLNALDSARRRLESTWGKAEGSRAWESLGGRSRSASMGGRRDPRRMAALLAIVGSFLLVAGSVGIFRPVLENRDKPSKKWFSLLLLSLGLSTIFGAFAQVFLHERSDHQGPRRPEASPSFLWAVCKYKDLAADASRFCNVYVRPGQVLVEGNAVSELPVTKVLQSTTCVCCLTDFRPSSQVAVLRCGHVFHRDCILLRIRSVSTTTPSCPICPSSSELPLS